MCEFYRKQITHGALTWVKFVISFNFITRKPQILVLQIGQEIYLKLKEKELKLKLEQQELNLALNPPSAE